MSIRCRPIPRSPSLYCPLPIIITLAATPDKFAYSVCGPSDLTHRHVERSDLGESDGLLAAAKKALESIRPARKGQLIGGHNRYRIALQQVSASARTSCTNASATSRDSHGFW